MEVRNMIFLSAGPKEPVHPENPGLTLQSCCEDGIGTIKPYHFSGGKTWILRVGEFFFGSLAVIPGLSDCKSIVRRPAFGASSRASHGDVGCWNMQLHALKLTFCTWKWAGPQNEGSSSNHQFSGAMLVSGRVAIRLSIVIWQFTFLHTQ